MHLDKNIYTPSESVQFTGYLLNSADSLSEHQTLSVALLGNNDKKVWAETKFRLSNGLSSGNLPLPDSLPAGTYTLLAYTNQLINGYPDARFTQPVTIKTPEPGFPALLTVDSTAGSMDSVQATLRVLTPQLLALSGAEVRYSRGTAPPTSFAKTNGDGEVHFAFPLLQLTPGNNTLQVQVRSGSESKTLSLVLPLKQTAALQVRFYPEGGHLVTGLAGVVGWEAKTLFGAPRAVRGILYEGGKPVDTIETSRSGPGRFTLTPKKDQAYTVQLLADSSTGTTYLLPPALPQGVALTLRQAVAADTLQLEVQNNMADQKLYLLLHNSWQVFRAFTLNGAQKQTAVAIPLSNLLKGLATLTLLDSTGRPWAERLFFAHGNQRPSLALQSDSATYGTRSKVSCASA